MGRALLVLVVAIGCVRPGAYHCRTNNECMLDGMQGVCEAVGFCSFPDGGCDGGFRYGAYAGPYANQCVTGDNSGFVKIGGRISGLVGSGLVLRNNGIDDLHVTSAGPFAFETELMAGVPYEATVAAQPSNPEQTCIINNSTGVTELTDVTNIDVDCSTRAYVVGGSVAGLIGTGLVLTNNGGNDLAISAAGTFTFTTPIPSGMMFEVAIKTQPAGQTCDVSGATGTVGTANVTTVVVNCTAGSYTLGGTVSGIEGTAILKNNGTDTATVTANGSFAFPTPLAPTTAYAVTIFAQPLYPPRNQTCTLMMGSGTMAAANVTTVALACTTNSFTVGGSVIGLIGTLVLQDNGADTLTVSANGAFVFPTRVASGATYTVTIAQQPPGQTCSISGSPSGIVTNGNVTAVAISCNNEVDPGILCGTVYCDPAIELCCIESGVPRCATSCAGGSGNIPIRCDDAADCAAAGQPQSICCGTANASGVTNVYCTANNLCSAPKRYYCDPNIMVPCPDGGTCMPTSEPFPGWYRCY